MNYFDIHLAIFSGHTDHDVEIKVVQISAKKFPKMWPLQIVSKFGLPMSLNL